MANKPHPYLVRLFFFLLFAAVVSGAYLFFPSKTMMPQKEEPTPTSTYQSTPTTTGALPKNETLSPQIPSAGQQNQITRPVKSITTQTEKIITTISISNETYPLAIKKGSTVYDAMQSLQNQGSITFSARQFTGMGYFIDEINGIKNDTSGGTYWFYYVNGKSSDTGISNYVIKSNDIISWKYAKSGF